MIVVSTGYAPPTKQRCIDSIKSQKNARFEHIWVDAREQLRPQNAMWNLAYLVSGFPPDTIIVCVDLDDWLAHDHALERIQSLHDAGSWVTYGSYQFADGRPGHARPYAGNYYRLSPWLATHPKSFRAGLFHRIKPDDMIYKGKWLHRCVDMATMFPCLEMAGNRVSYCPDILYTYNWANSFEFSANDEGLREEREIEKWIRTRPAYKEIECL